MQEVMQKLQYVLNTLKTEKKELEKFADDDWCVLAQTVGLQTAIDLLEETFHLI